MTSALPMGFQSWLSHAQTDDTVEPSPVETPLLWTPRHCGHLSPGPFGFPYLIMFIKFH